MNQGRSKQRTIKEKERQLLKEIFIFGVFVELMFAYASFTVCAYLDKNPQESVLGAIKPAMGILFKDPLYFWPISPAWIAPTAGIMFIIFCVCFFMYTTQKIRVHHDSNTLKGSTEWANINDMVEKYAEFEEKDYKHAFYNAICSENFQMSVNQKKHYHALNTLILGTTGSGKSRYYLKPNLLQMNCCYVVTDPSGGILQSCGETLRRFGYNIRVFDLVDMGNCNTYNPMKYCKKESDVKALVDAFIKNTAPPGQQSGGNQDPFWDNAMNAFLCSTISLLTTYGDNPDIMGGYIYEPCFANLCELTRMANRKAPGGPSTVGRGGEGNTASGSELNVIFERIKASLKEDEDKPYCLREWENFKIAPEKTSTTILMTAAVRLDPFNIQQVKELTSTDTVCLDTFGDGRDALFVITPTNDSTYNYLVSFMYTQLFNILYTKGEKENLGTIDLKLQNGELVKHFTKEQVDAGIDEEVQNIQNSTIRPVEVGGQLKVTVPKKKRKKKKLPPYIWDGYYEIVSGDGETVISRRPTKELATQYVHELRNLKRVKGNGESLPSHIRFLLDEFANIGEIPLFKEKLATMRKYEISCTVICQSITQLKGMYEKDYEVIDGNCPTTIFLGGDENSNNKYVSEKLGSSTVKSAVSQINKNGGGPSFNLDKRSIMDPEELGRMPFDDMLVMVYGEQPIYDKKYNYPAHKNYRFTYDFAHGDAGVEAFAFDRKVFPDITKVLLRYEAAKVTCVPTITELNEDEFMKIFAAPTPEVAMAKMEESNPRWVFDTVAV